VNTSRREPGSTALAELTVLGPVTPAPLLMARSFSKAACSLSAVVGLAVLAPVAPCFPAVTEASALGSSTITCNLSNDQLDFAPALSHTSAGWVEGARWKGCTWS
jgi:hypothetical protein